MLKIIVGFSSVLFLASTHFRSCKSMPANDITAIHLVNSTPIVNWDSSLTDITKDYDVFYFKDLILYRFMYIFDSSFNRRPVLLEKRNFFFIFHKDSSFGYSYYTDRPDRKSVARENVDSVLNEGRFRTDGYDTLLIRKADSSFINADGDLVKIYKYPSSPTYPENSTFYAYYTKRLAKIPESLSKKLDNIQYKKLFRIRAVAHGGYYQQFNMRFPEREVLLELKEFENYNKEEVMHYFRIYQQEIMHRY
jgi:hypothetical protein